MRRFLSALGRWIRRHPFLVLGAALALAGAAWWGGRHLLAAHHWRSAQRFVAQRQLEDAQVSVTTCIHLWSGRPEVHLLAARIARLRQEDLEAARRLESARKLGGNLERIVLEKYLQRAARGELDQVESKLLAFLHKNDHDSIAILDVLTYQWMLAHRLGDVSSRLDRWVALAPRDPEPHVRRAWVSERVRDMPGALAEYQQALDLDPERDQRQGNRVRLRFAELLLERLRPQEALAQFEILVQRQHPNAAVQFGLARCRLLLGQGDEGRRLLADLVRENPDHASGWSELARALSAQEQWLEAETHFRRAVALAPYDRATVFGMQQCLERLGKKDEARALQQRLDRIQADERLMAELMTAVQKTPDDPGLRQRIGEIFLRNGMVNDGLIWLRSALLYDRAFVAAHEVLAEWWESRAATENATPHRLMLERLGIPKRGNRFQDRN